MAEKLELLDRDYLSKMPKGTSRPRLTVQDEQAGACVELPYYTENPEPDEVQCALAWYTGAFADRERQLGVEVLLDALLGTNNSPLKAALLAESWVRISTSALMTAPCSRCWSWCCAVLPERLQAGSLPLCARPWTAS